MKDSDPSNAPHDDLSEAAAASEAQIKDTLNSLVDLDAFQGAGDTPTGEPPSGSGEPLSPEVRGMAVGSVVADLVAEDAADPERRTEPGVFRSRGRWLRILMLLFALVVLGGAILAAAVLVIGSRTDDPAGNGSAPIVAQDGAAGPEAPPPDAGDCAVDPGAVAVSTTTTSNAPDSHGTTIRGETTITNTGDVPVNVAWRASQSTGHDNSGAELLDEGWYGGPFLLQPGETRTELVGVRVFDSGERTWTLITDLAAFADSPACLNQVLQEPDTAYEHYARPVENPFPAGP